MELNDKAYLTTQPAGEWLVIEDAPLLQWAASRGISPSVAQVKALEQGIIPLRYIKNFSAMNIEEQIRICRGRVLVCGCGGLGGFVGGLLGRAGVGFIRLIDGDVFAPSNLNRQWFSEVRQLDRPKALAGKETILRANPLIDVEALQSWLDASNIADVFQDVDLVLDALDNIRGRFLLAEGSRRHGIPYIHAAVSGWWGQISTFLPSSSLTLESIYGSRRLRDPEEDALGVLGPTAAVIGSMEALEALRILAGRSAAYSDRLLYFDGESGQTSLIPLR